MPVGVLMTRSTSPRSIQSTTCGEPSASLLIRSTGMPMRAIARAVPARGDDPEAEVVQLGGDPHRGRLVGVGDGEEHGARPRQRDAGRGLRLGERGREVARRRPSPRRSSASPGRAARRSPRKRSNGSTASLTDTWRRPRIVGQAEVGEPLAEHHPAGHLGQRHAGRLGDEGHGPRRARVGLDHVDVVVVAARTARSSARRRRAPSAIVARVAADLVEHRRRRASAAAARRPSRPSGCRPPRRAA